MASQIEALLDQDITTDSVASVYWNAVVEDGDVEGLLQHLERLRKAEDVEAARLNAISRCEAHVLWRRGDLELAKARVDALLADSPDSVELIMWRAGLADALGQIPQAKEGYERALELDDSDEIEKQVRLRLALMGLVGSSTDDQSELAEFASSQDDAELRNRAAIVLAVQDRPKDAIELFVVEGEDTHRFRDESRVAEWAIRAQDAQRAQQAAWSAVRAAELRRDRRYALTLLVEAHRLDDTIDALIDRFAAEEQLTPSERRVWIDLLRERERYDEAIELFRTSADGDFTIEMRRELLEMEREAGREEQMIAAYRELIDDEPDELTWRAGLAQVLLERGDQADAEQLWPAYIATLNSGPQLLACAQAQAGLGLDDLAVATTDRMVALDVESGPALLFLAELHRDRGRLAEAEQTLDQLDLLAPANDSLRFELAEAYEQLGRQHKAVEVMEGIREARETVAEDLEIRLAWLYSEIGEEEKGLNLWLGLWRRINSVPRRRYVEDRLMSVASRLGMLADIAIELEEKLIDGVADEREAGLLVRIYTRVNDPVSATEVLGDYMRQTGGSEIDALTEKARIFLICNDYHNYEQTIHAMIAADPEGEGEYLRQLAMSQLERGRPDEAREVLTQLRDIEIDSISREFEAGVLTLAGMRTEAAEAYRKGIAEHPDRIESYLLLAGLMREFGHQQRAIGMFQYLAETADRDDMFTIAIDGLLNMEAGRATVQWARRITLERLAGREDKNYLYQLLADLSEEAGDVDGQVRALENSIAIAGTRRLSILRECMDLSSNIRGGVFYQPGRGPTNAGNEPFFAFARRLIGLQEAVPPQVFLDLGQAFLADKEVRSAWQTFGLARNLPDERSYRRDVASIFETGGHRAEALRLYERLLRTSPSDIGLIAKVAQIHEQEGRDEVASRFYQRGLELLIRQAPITTAEEGQLPVDGSVLYYWSSNLDAYQTFYDRIIRGVLVTVPDDDGIEALLAAHRSALSEELELLENEIEAGVEVKQLDGAPRIQKRATALRRMLLAFDHVVDADRMDADLMRRFPEDEGLLKSLAGSRVERGYYASARRLAERSSRGENELRAVRVLTGEAFDENSTDLITPAEALRQLLPLLVNGDRENARSLLRRVDHAGLSAEDPRLATRVVIINGVATVQSQGGSSGSQFIRVSNRLGDPDLALRFARGWFKAGIDTGVLPQVVTNVYDQCVTMLSEEHREGFARYVADVVTENSKRLATHFTLLAKVGEELEENLIDPEALLEALEASSVAVGWQMPVDQLLQALPEEMQSAALDRALRNTPEGRRADALIAVPYASAISLPESVAAVLHDHFVGDLQAAKEAGMLEYIAGRIPGGEEPLRRIENAELALAMIDKLQPFIPAKEIDALQARRALIFRQVGRVDDALDITFQLQAGAEPGPDAYMARSARTELFRIMMRDYPARFLATLDEREQSDGASVELTDERIDIVRRANDPELLGQEYERAVARHPVERRYLQMLEGHYRRTGRVRDALALAQQNLDQLRAGMTGESTGPTKEQVTEAMITYVLSNVAAQGIDESMLRESYERMADGLTLGELIERAEAMGATIPNGGRATTLVVEKRLASMFDQLEAPLRSLELWRSIEAQEREQFEEEMATEDASGEASESGTKAAGRGAVAVTPAVRLAPAAGSATTSIAVQRVPARVTSDGEEPDAETPDSIEGVRDALAAEDIDSARRMLRRLWRVFPVDDDRGLIVRYPGAGPAAHLMWPELPPDEDESDESEEPQPTPKEQAQQEAERRQRLRGGLATFQLPEQRTRPPQTSAWQVLADHPFAVEEMQRIVRSRNAAEIQGIKPVLLALLQADRLKRGDAMVREELLAAVREGIAGERTLVQLFALLNDAPEALRENDSQLLDDLVRLLDPSETRMLSRIAWLYAAIGQHDKAIRLYEYCATNAQMTRSMYYYDPFGVDQSIGIETLVTELREHFEGTKLLEAVDRVFAAVSNLEHDAEALAIVAETWAELLPPEQVAQRMRGLFDDLEHPQKALNRGLGVTGARVFARAGQSQEARRCLRATLRTYHAADFPEEFRYSFSRRSEIPGSLSHISLFDLFPEDMTDFVDPQAWLSGAAAEIEQLLSNDLVDPSLVTRARAVIALRLHERGESDAARDVLQAVLANPGEDATTDDRLFLADVATELGLVEDTLRITGKLHDDQQLPAVRFGDLVRLTHAVDGAQAAKSLADDLLVYSSDEDLLDAAIALTADAAEWSARHSELEALRPQVVHARTEIRKIRKQVAEWAKIVREKHRGETQ